MYGMIAFRQCSLQGRPRIIQRDKAEPYSATRPHLSGQDGAVVCGWSSSALSCFLA